MNLIGRLCERFFARRFPGLGIAGVEISGDILTVEYFRTPLIKLHGKKEIPIREIRSMVFWEADGYPTSVLTCRIDWSGGSFDVGQLDRGFQSFLAELEERYDQPDIDNRAWAGEIVYMIKDGEPVGRIF